MNKEKGMAYCGLACFLCSESSDCAGCRNDGCKDKGWCKSYACCKQKGIAGCWECPELSSCDNFMLKKPKIGAFAAFISEYGEQRLIRCLEENEKDGVIYHYDGQIVGDYDACATREEIFALILKGDK